MFLYNLLYIYSHKIMWYDEASNSFKVFFLEVFNLFSYIDKRLELIFDDCVSF